MKKFILILCMQVFCFAFSKEIYSQTALNTVANFQILNGGAQFEFEIYSLRTSDPAYRMGLTTYVLNFANGALSNPILTYQSPRFSTGNYSAMTTEIFFNRQVAVQINYASGSGQIVSNDTGATGYGELIARVQLDVVNAVNANLTWDPSSSGIVTPTFLPIIFNMYQGDYNGPLPVELSNFSSSVSENKVKLYWTTSEEQNNSGFEIQRKTISDNLANDWINLNFVAGHGNSNSANNYSYEDKNLSRGNYKYRLKQIDLNGNYKHYEMQNEVQIGAPTVFELKQNYPNPFNPSTKINFTLPEASRVSLKIFDISGRLVSTLLNNEFKSADYYSVDFNASNLSSGAYFYSVQTESLFDTRKMMLIK